MEKWPRVILWVLWKRKYKRWKSNAIREAQKLNKRAPFHACTVIWSYELPVRAFSSVLRLFFSDSKRDTKKFFRFIPEAVQDTSIPQKSDSFVQIPQPLSSFCLWIRRWNDYCVTRSCLQWLELRSPYRASQSAQGNKNNEELWRHGCWIPPESSLGVWRWCWWKYKTVHIKMSEGKWKDCSGLLFLPLEFTLYKVFGKWRALELTERNTEW